MKKAVEELGDIIKNQTNVKELKIKDGLSGIKEKVKADFAKLGPIFGAKSPKVIAHIATQSPETILNHISKEGVYSFNLDGESIGITKDHLISERQIPEPFVEAEAKTALVYINKERTEELESEGYSREVMRRIQSLRKKEGLEKTDRIALHIKSEEDAKEMLLPWQEQIKLKCGAEKIVISSENPARKHNYVSSEKIKDYTFEISFDKI